MYIAFGENHRVYPWWLKQLIDGGEREREREEGGEEDRVAVLEQQNLYLSKETWATYLCFSSANMASCRFDSGPSSLISYQQNHLIISNFAFQNFRFGVQNAHKKNSTRVDTVVNQDTHILH